MVYTEELKKILGIDFTKQSVCAVNALAGTGKTTSLVELILKNPHIKFLYTAFNVSVIATMKKKKSEYKLRNLKAGNLHSIAWGNSKYKGKDGIPVSNLTLDFVFEYCALRNTHKEDRQKAEMIKYIFENFLLQTDSLKKYRKEMLKRKKIKFLFPKSNSKHLDILKSVFDYVEIIYQRMGKKDSDIPFVTHSFYLREFIREKQVIKEDVLLVDEAQDLNLLMFEFIVSQLLNGKSVVVVGDNNQIIYKFINSKNILKFISQDFNATQFSLTSSYRFEADTLQEITANRILNHRNLTIKGVANYEDKFIYNDAFICRSNLSVLDKTLELIDEKTPFFLQGGIEGFDVTQIFDIANLLCSNEDRIKSSFIKSFDDEDDLKSYISESMNSELSTNYKIAKKYLTYDGDKNIFKLFNLINSKNNKNANTTVSTFHKAKGLDFDRVSVWSSKSNYIPYCLFPSMNDYYCKGEKVKVLEYHPEKTNVFEEFNLAYIAVTRAKKKLYLEDEQLKLSIDVLDYVCKYYSNKKNKMRESNPEQKILDENGITHKALQFGMFYIKSKDIKKYIYNFKNDIKN